MWVQRVPVAMSQNYQALSYYFSVGVVSMCFPENMISTHGGFPMSAGDSKDVEFQLLPGFIIAGGWV